MSDEGRGRASRRPNRAVVATDESRSVPRALERSWSDWRVGLAAVIALAAGAALLSAWLTPRGPITTAEALISMAAALGGGIAAGLVMGRRWSILVLPVVFVAVFEIARLRVDGPTVDGIHLGTLYGIIAFVLGRLFHGVLVLVPMMLGAAYGVSLSARIGRRRAGRMGPLGWTFAGAVTAGIVVLAFFIARPASTAPIIDAEGEPLAGGVAELVTVSIGGHDQVLMIRGRSTDNPVLLYLTGGPGGTDIGAMRRDVGLEQDFVVVVWEQRGTGKSYSALDPVETLTLERVVADTVEVTNYLRERFGEDRIYLVGNSWGATLGVLAVQQHPDLFHAYVGTGQMVSQRETDIMFYEDTLAWAEQTGNEGLARTLRQNGPPPYENIRNYEHIVAHEHDWNSYPYFDPGNEMPAILFVPEYTFMDRVNAFRAFLDTASVIYPQLQDIDFRRDVPSLPIPVYLVMGEYESRGRAVLATEWFEMLDAPTKELVIFERSGHRPLFDEPAAFATVMRRVMDETYGR